MFNFLFGRLFGRRITIVLKSGYEIHLRGVREFECTVGENASYSVKWMRPHLNRNLLVLDPRQIAAVLF